MKIKIEPSIARGIAMAPPSKSYAHRLLICSALANGTSTIKGVSDSEDMEATLDCILALGVPYEKNRDIVTINGTKFSENKTVFFNCRESGSTIRFFIPIALAIGGSFEFFGTKRLLSRGFQVYEEICREQGITFINDGTKINTIGKLIPGTFNVRGDISSQFISGLLFALPMLNGDSTINITTKLESASYIDITIDALKSFGVEIVKNGSSFFIKGNQNYKPTNVSVEADASNSAFLDAFNFLGGEVSVLGLNSSTLQPDGIYLNLFNMLKAEKPEIDLSNCPDLAPILFALSATMNGAKFTGTKRLKIKESDRAAAMATELEKLGIKVDVYENSVIVNKGKLKKPSQILNGHNDHRIVMALAVISTIYGGTIDGCEAVAKSYPDFFEEIGKLGIRYAVI